MLAPLRLDDIALDIGSADDAHSLQAQLAVLVMYLVLVLEVTGVAEYITVSESYS